MSKIGNRRLSTEFVKSEIIKRGYIPQFEVYTGNMMKFDLIDELGYKYYTSWTSFYKSEPYKFHKTNPYTIDNIKLWLKLNNKPYQILSTEYTTNASKLMWYCPKHEKFEYSWNHMQLYTGCRECAIEESIKRMATPWSEVERFIKQNFGDSISVVDNSNYESLHSKIIVKCNICGYVWFPEVNNLKRNHGCDACAKNNLSLLYRRDIEYIINKTKELSPHVDIIDDFSEYKNGETKLKCYCETHKIYFNQSVDMLLLGVACKECGLDKQRGKNNCNWNKNITDEERFKRRYLYDSNGMNQRLWSKEILKMYDYKCVLCDNELSSNLRAHHIVPYAKLENKYELNNGVCLCECCHDAGKIGSFHNIYGTRSFTEYDFYEYYKNIKGIEFNINNYLKGENENE